MGACPRDPLPPGTLPCPPIYSLFSPTPVRLPLTSALLGSHRPQFWMLILATTIPMPAGYFMPIFILGESGVLRV